MNSVFRNARAARGMTAAVVGVAGLALPGVVNADVIAYWRFEDKNGTAATAGDTLTSPTPGGTPFDFTTDSAGVNDSLRTFHSPNDPTSADGVERLETAPIYTSDVPFSSIPSTGAANLLAFDFDGLPGQAQQPAGTAPNQAGGDDIYTAQAGELNAYDFDAFTIEASFKIDTLGRFQKIIGKDDPADVAAGGLGPIVLGPLNDNRLEIVAFDGSGAFRNVIGADPLEAGVWYNVAVTNDGSTMSLYLDDTRDGVGNYVLLGTNTDITGGALVQSDATWAVGRGWFNAPADAFDGQIDEVRISDTALDPSAFLFTPVPEPTSIGLLGAGLLLLQRRRRAS